MAKINAHFDVVLKYYVPIAHWRGTEDFINVLRRWCKDNLQYGYDVLHLTMMREEIVVAVTDETDYDLLILTWGK